jgi:DNA-binding MarR family transcriptional regulator
MRSITRIANETWEALFRAQATIGQQLSASGVWSEIVPREYGVLYALSKAPDGLRIADLGDDVLLTQPGKSRLVGRLAARGIVQRVADPDDARAQRIRLTEVGAELQRRVGLAHGREVAQAMTRRLDRDELLTLRDLCSQIIADSEQVDVDSTQRGSRAGTLR